MASGASFRCPDLAVGVCKSMHGRRRESEWERRSRTPEGRGGVDVGDVAQNSGPDQVSIKCSLVLFKSIMSERAISAF